MPRFLDPEIPPIPAIWACRTLSDKPMAHALSCYSSSSASTRQWGSDTSMCLRNTLGSIPSILFGPPWTHSEPPFAEATVGQSPGILTSFYCLGDSGTGEASVSERYTQDTSGSKSTFIAEVPHVGPSQDPVCPVVWRDSCSGGAAKLTSWVQGPFSPPSLSGMCGRSTRVHRHLQRRGNLVMSHARG